MLHTTRFIPIGNDSKLSRLILSLTHLRLVMLSTFIPHVNCNLCVSNVETREIKYLHSLTSLLVCLLKGKKKKNILVKAFEARAKSFERLGSLAHENSKSSQNCQNKMFIPCFCFIFWYQMILSSQLNKIPQLS
jgi:hypothetical protein